ncbi:MAG TPA: tetratricopeptide repeat protein [Vicinamibacteria bacterium]|nr:tetratricopeptide repeat protein [Vicinamibacteria bacterium]
MTVASLLAAYSSQAADPKVYEAFTKANEQIVKGKPEEAEKTMQKLVNSNPGPEAFGAQGRLLELLGKLDAAGDAYSKGADLGSGAAKADTMALHADYMLRTGPAKAALARAEQAVQVAATSGTLAALARVQARVEPTKALETADKAVAAGASADAHQARGIALLALGRNDDAAAACRRAIELDARSARAQATLAAALTAAGKGAEAVAAARKAVELDGSSAEAHAILGAAIHASDPKLWNEAIGEAQDGAFKNPKSPEIQIIVGKLFEGDGRFDQAAKAYQAALAADPDFSPGRSALINAQFRKGDLDGALAEARKLAAAAPHSGEAQLLLGELLLRKNDFEGAVAALEKAVHLLPGSANAHAYLARAYHSTGKVKEAVGEYAKAVQADAANADLRSNYGLALAQVGQHAQAADELKKVVATPGYKKTDGYTNLGFAYRSMEPPRNEDAIAAYKKALELEPKNAQAALGLAWVYLNAKRYTDSIAACRQAIQIDSALTGACNQTMAWAYLSSRQFKEAREALTAADKAGAGNPKLDALLDRIEKAGPTMSEEAMADLEKERQAQARLQAQLEQIERDTKDGNPATRIRGVRNLVAKAGADGVSMLTWMLYNDKNTDVRIEVARSLGSLGAGARKACPQLQAIARTDILPDPGATKAQAEEELRLLDLQKACRDAVAKSCR